jgi:hypothetical protein
MEEQPLSQNKQRFTRLAFVIVTVLGFYAGFMSALAWHHLYAPLQAKEQKVVFQEAFLIGAIAHSARTAETAEVRQFWVETLDILRKSGCEWDEPTVNRWLIGWEPAEPSPTPHIHSRIQ